MKRAWMLVLTLALAVVLAAGCGGNGGGGATSTNPEDAVKGFWEAFTSADFDKAAQFVVSDQQDEVRSIRDEYLGDDLFDDELLKLILGSFSVKTTGHTVTGENATVDAVVNLPDMEFVFEKMFSVFFEMSMDEEMDEAAMEEMMAELFLEALKEADSIEESVTFELVMEDGQWRLVDMPDLDALMDGF